MPSLGLSVVRGSSHDSLTPETGPTHPDVAVYAKSPLFFGCVSFEYLLCQADWRQVSRCLAHRCCPRLDRLDDPQPLCRCREENPHPPIRSGALVLPQVNTGGSKSSTSISLLAWLAAGGLFGGWSVFSAEQNA